MNILLFVDVDVDGAPEQIAFNTQALSPYLTKELRFLLLLSLLKRIIAQSIWPLIILFIRPILPSARVPPGSSDPPTIER